MSMALSFSDSEVPAFPVSLVLPYVCFLQFLASNCLTRMVFGEQLPTLLDCSTLAHNMFSLVIDAGISMTQNVPACASVLTSS